MRYLKILLVGILFTVITDSYGQRILKCPEDATTQIDDKDSVIFIADKMPYLKDGVEEYYEWINSHMDNKLKAKRKEEKRKVYSSFVVNPDGTLSDFKIMKGLGDPYDMEALRLIKENPQEWIAGECGDNKVRTRMTMPIQF